MHATETPDPSLIRAGVAGSNPSSEEAPKVLVAGRVERGEKDCKSGITHPKPETPAPARRRRWQKFVRRGRPSTFNEDVADAMYESILETGVTDSRAGLLANVSTSTVSRWKQEDPDFAEFLETARSKFEFAEIKKIRHAKRRDGQPNAQNAKWLLQHTNPEVWGGRSRKRPGAAASSVPAPALHQNDVDPHRFAVTHQRKTHQNIPEIEPTNEPANCDSRTPFVDPEWEANLAENEALRDAVIAEITELESARFRAAQQSKSQPNIPEIPVTDEPCYDSSTPVEECDLESATAETDAPQDGISYFPREALEALIYGRHQSKSLPVIPEIPVKTL